MRHGLFKKHHNAASQKWHEMDDEGIFADEGKEMKEDWDDRTLNLMCEKILNSVRDILVTQSKNKTIVYEFENEQKKELKKILENAILNNKIILNNLYLDKICDKFTTLLVSSIKKTTGQMHLETRRKMEYVGTVDDYGIFEVPNHRWIILPKALFSKTNKDKFSDAVIREFAALVDNTIPRKNILQTYVALKM